MRRDQWLRPDQTTGAVTYQGPISFVDRTRSLSIVHGHLDSLYPLRPFRLMILTMPLPFTLSFNIPFVLPTMTRMLVSPDHS